MSELNGLALFVLGFVHPRQVLDSLEALPRLFASLDPAWWLIAIYPVLRFLVPYVVLWCVWLLRPRIIRPPAGAVTERQRPLVSVVIAGRNEADSIAATLESVLRCGYSNLEVLYVDDGSSDGTAAIARRVAQQSQLGSQAMPCRLRVFTSPRRNGKPSALNIGLSAARGEFIAIIDADCELQFGSIQHWLAPFADPRVGAVAANLRVDNAARSLCTQLQECEYAISVTVARLITSRLGVLAIVPGAGGMFRASIVHGLGGYDTGLGDDTDMTMRLRKGRWRLGYAVDAIVWTRVPVTWRHLISQRTRWERNMVKVRLSKHRDMLRLGRYGLANAALLLDMMLVRVWLPWMAVVAVLIGLTKGPMVVQMLVTDMYWLTATWMAIKLLIARDIGGTPQHGRLWLALLLPLYRLGLKLLLMMAQAREVLRLGRQHAYVPPHIWQEVPHW